MDCENSFCLNQKDGICTLEKISVNSYGMCADYDITMVSEELLLRIKTMQKRYGDVLKNMEDNYVEVSKLVKKEPHLEK